MMVNGFKADLLPIGVPPYLYSCVIPIDSNPNTYDEQSTPAAAVILHRTVRIETEPSHCGLGRYDEFTVSCIGVPDPQTGYLVDIHAIDDLVRTHLVPILDSSTLAGSPVSPVMLLPDLWKAAQAWFPHQIVSLSWSLTPLRRIEMDTSTSNAQFIVRQRYEFSASHRLHSEALDAATNQRIFGKCNNPNGHGHNYQVEPAIRLGLDDHQHALTKIDDLVENQVLSQLDHKHLNVDCPAFDQAKGGVMPSVENIAKHCYELLRNSVSQLADDAQLVQVTVWETDRTSCTYPA